MTRKEISTNKTRITKSRQNNSLQNQFTIISSSFSSCRWHWDDHEPFGDLTRTEKTWPTFSMGFKRYIRCFAVIPCIVQLLLHVQILEWVPEILLPSTCCLAWHTTKKSYNAQHRKYVDGRDPRFKMYKAIYTFLVRRKFF